MTTTPKALFEAKFAEAADTPQYTAVNCKTSIDKLTATNTGAANETLTLNVIPSGGAVAASNAITVQIAPGKTWPFPETIGHILEAGDAISTKASTANKIWIRGSGREFT